MDVTPEQVVNEIKRRGGFDAMREEMYSHFVSSDKGMRLEALIKQMLNDIQDKSDYIITDPARLEQLLFEKLE
ncbi:hypothetical protein EV182_004988, partial [Spiromyces aspiralis]